MFRPIKPGVFGVGNFKAGIALDHVAAVKSLLGQPDVAAGILERLGGTGLDPNDALCWCCRRRCRGLNCRRERRGDQFDCINLRILNVAE